MTTRWITFGCCVVVLYVVVWVTFAHSQTRQYRVAVWDAVCIVKLEKGKNARVEAPVDDHGHIDKKHSTLTGLIATLDDDCMHFEVRR